MQGLLLVHMPRLACGSQKIALVFHNVASGDRTSTLRPISRAGDEHEDQPSPTGGAATAPKGAHPRSRAR